MTMAEPRKPEAAAAATVDVDWISSLPDSLVCHILSFLPTTSSVATCILSRRWRHLWKDLQVFTFSYAPKGLLGQEAHTHFISSVNAVLAQRTARDIRKFSIHYDPNDSFNATTWISAAIGPYLEDLQLYLWSDGVGWKFVVPPSVFTCTALVNLNLRGRIVADAELTQDSKVRLPSLKTLTMELDSLDNIDRVLCGCPVLETLDLTVRTAGSLKTSAPKIRVPSLKSFKFIDSGNPAIVQLEIDTPSLEYLSIAIMTPCYQISFCNLQNVVEAHLNCHAADKYVGYISKLLTSLCRAKLLVMQRITVAHLLRTPTLGLPEFRDLLNLELNLPRFDTSFLVNMLQRCHMLQVLTIYKEKDASPSWTQPTSVPNCLVSQLSIVNFSKYCGSKDDQEFIAYILQEGLVLTAVTIRVAFSANLKRNHGIREELSLLSRVSKTCQLNFN